MEKRDVTNRFREFRAKLREEANKVIESLELEQRILEKNWIEPRRNPQLWSDIA